MFAVVARPDQKNGSTVVHRIGPEEGSYKITNMQLFVCGGVCIGTHHTKSSCLTTNMYVQICTCMYCMYM